MDWNGPYLSPSTARQHRLVDRLKPRSWAVSKKIPGASRQKNARAPTSRWGFLYHNGTPLYQNESIRRDILYSLNGRRTKSRPNR